MARMQFPQIFISGSFFFYLFYGIVRVILFGLDDKHPFTSSSNSTSNTTDPGHRRAFSPESSAESSSSSSSSPPEHHAYFVFTEISYVYMIMSILHVLMFFLAFYLVTSRKALIFTKSFTDRKVHNLFVALLTIIFVAYNAYNAVFSFEHGSHLEAIKSLLDILFGILSLNIEVFGDVVAAKLTIYGKDFISSSSWLFMIGYPLFEFVIYFLTPVFQYDNYEFYIESFSTLYSSVFLSTLRPLSIAFLFDLFGSFLIHFFAHHAHHHHEEKTSSRKAQLMRDAPRQSTHNSFFSPAETESDVPMASMESERDGKPSGSFTSELSEPPSSSAGVNASSTALLSPEELASLPPSSHAAAAAAATTTSSSSKFLAPPPPKTPAPKLPKLPKLPKPPARIKSPFQFGHRQRKDQELDFAGISNNHNHYSNWKQLDLMYVVIVVPVFFALLALNSGSSGITATALHAVQIGYHAIYIVLLFLCFFFLWRISKFRILSYTLNSVYRVEFLMLLTTGLLSIGSDFALIHLHLTYETEEEDPKLIVAERFLSLINVPLQIFLVFVLFVGSLEDNYAEDFRKPQLKFAIFYVHWFIHSLAIYNVLWLFLNVVAENSLHHVEASKPLIASLEVMLPLAVEFRTTYARLAAMYGFRSKRLSEEIEINRRALLA